MLLTRLIALAALSAGATAVAQEAPPAPEPTTITVEGEKPPAEEKFVCKVTTTGTMMRKRICMPKEEWAKAESNSEETLKGLRDWQRVRCSMGTAC